MSAKALASFIAGQRKPPHAVERSDRPPARTLPAAWPGWDEPRGSGRYSSFRWITPASWRALRCTVRFWVAKSTPTSPKRAT